MKYIMDDFTEKVFIALDNAVQNGFELDTWPADEIVTNMIMYAKGFEHRHEHKLTTSVKQWLQTNS